MSDNHQQTRPHVVASSSEPPPLSSSAQLKRSFPNDDEVMSDGDNHTRLDHPFAAPPMHQSQLGDVESMDFSGPSSTFMPNRHEVKHSPPSSTDPFWLPPSIKQARRGRPMKNGSLNSYFPTASMSSVERPQQQQQQLVSRPSPGVAVRGAHSRVGRPPLTTPVTTTGVLKQSFTRKAFGPSNASLAGGMRSASPSDAASSNNTTTKSENISSNNNNITNSNTNMATPNPSAMVQSPQPIASTTQSSTPASAPSPPPPTQLPVDTTPAQQAHHTGGTTTPRGGGSGRGRPKGWKPGMSYAQMRGTTATDQQHLSRQTRPKPPGATTTTQYPGVPKRRGRPPKQASPPPRALYHSLDPAFVAFLCEWRGCKAELHNLETLRRHVDYVHVEDQQEGEDGQGWFCEWGRCGDDHGEQGGGRKFGTLRMLEAHVRTAHMEPFAWHVGDGPMNQSGYRKKKKKRSKLVRQTGGNESFDGEEEEEEEDVPAYLKDKEGNQVTPSVEGQQMEDYVTWRDNRRKLKELLLKRDRDLPSEEEDDDDRMEGDGEDDELG